MYNSSMSNLRDMGNMTRNPWTKDAVEAANKETGKEVIYQEDAVDISQMDWADAAEAYDYGYCPSSSDCSFWVKVGEGDLGTWWEAFERHNKLMEDQASVA